MAAFSGFALGQGTISSISPNNAAAHSPATGISIAGSNLTGAASVVFTAPGGTPVNLTPSQVQAAQLTVIIPPALLSTAGTAQIAVQNAAGVLSNQLPFTIRAGIAIAPPALAGGDVGAPYSDTLGATGGNAPYLWALISGVLPKGLGLASSGAISGVPTEPGTVGFTALVTDASGAVASVLASVVVKPAALSFTIGALPLGYVNSEYPKQILEASGGVPPYTFAVTAGSLPLGLALSNGVISGIITGIPGGAFTITATDATGATATSDTSIFVYSVSPGLELLSGSVSFSSFTGATELPPAQTVGIQSAIGATTMNYTVATKNAPWLLVTGGGTVPGSLTVSGTTPGSLTVSLTPVALSLAAGTQTTTITVTCTSTACAGNTQNVTVSLVVSSPPAQVSVSNTLLAFTSSTTPPQNQTQPLGIQNEGGGSLTVTSIICQALWCSAGTSPTTITGGSVVQFPVTVIPSRLSAGFFRTTVDIITSAGNASVPVSLFISSSPNMNLAPAVTQYVMQAGAAPGNPSGSFLVSSAGGTLNWSAALLPGATWLTLSTASGTASDATPGTVRYSINTGAANLAAGTYYGTIEVKAAGALNPVQDYQVILIVTPATEATKPDPQPAGLIFLTTVGGIATPQTVNVYAGSKTPALYSASVNTDTGAWLAINALTGIATSDVPAQSTIGIGTAGLKQGIYRGSVNYAFAGAGIRTVNVTLIVQPTNGGAATLLAAGLTRNALKPKAVTCAPEALVPAQTGLVNNFAAAALLPTPIAITLYNDCGNTVPDGQVVVTFSNGDAPLLLSLANAATGLYSGTWTPRNSAAQVSLSASATATGLTAATTTLLGSVVPNVAPGLLPNSVANPFNPYQVDGAVAPGTIVAMYGSNLAGSAGQPTSIPLPTSISGTEVLIGGIAAPLFYVGPGQVNAQIPFELDPTKQYQVVVNANGALSAPQTIQLTAAAPGINALADGTIAAYHTSDGTLVSQASPAKPGEFIVMYLLGMGPTDNAVITGDASPGDPLARPTTLPTVTLAGTPVSFAFAGLTPSLVGLYQINLQIPDVAADGNLVLTVSQNGVVSNTTILPVSF